MFREPSDATPRRRQAEDWAACQAAGARALAALGRISGDAGVLAKAAGGFRRALQIWTGDPAAMRWAVTQAELAEVLRELGELEDADADTLADAAEAARAALAVAARDEAPVLFAMARITLADVLRLEAARDAEEAPVREAVELLEGALDALTPEAAPELWAIGQVNLATARMTLAAIEPAEAMLELAWAREALREALLVLTREDEPEIWALTQQRLGEALAAQYALLGRSGLLPQAIAAFEAAVEVRSREAAPMEWARIQVELAPLLKELEPDGERAAAAWRAALEVLTRERAPRAWARAQSGLGRVLEERGYGEPGTASLEAAVVHCRAALEIWTSEATPREWVLDRLLLGQVLVELGDRTGQRAHWREALALAELIRPVPARGSLADATAECLVAFIEGLRKDARRRLRAH